MTAAAPINLHTSGPHAHVDTKRDSDQKMTENKMSKVAEAAIFAAGEKHDSTATAAARTVAVAEREAQVEWERKLFSRILKLEPLDGAKKKKPSKAEAKAGVLSKVVTGSSFLTAREELLLKTMFQNWRLDQNICLLDLWALHVSTRLEAVGLLDPAQEFRRLYMLAYSIQWSGWVDELSGEVSSKVKVPWETCMSPQIADFLAKLLTSIKAEAAEKNVDAAEILEVIAIGIKFLKQPNSSDLMGDCVVDYVGSECLANKSNSRKNLDDLTTWIRFMQQAMDAAQSIVPEYDWFFANFEFGNKPSLEYLLEYLRELKKCMTKPEAVREVKKALIEMIRTLAYYRSVFSQAINDICRGEKTPLQALNFIKTNKLWYVGDEVEDPEVIKLSIKAVYVEAIFTGIFLSDVQRILDNQILEAVLPKPFYPQDRFLMRALFQLKHDQDRLMAALNPQMTSTPQGNAFEIAVQKEVQALLKTVTINKDLKTVTINKDFLNWLFANTAKANLARVICGADYMRYMDYLLRFDTLLPVIDRIFEQLEAVRLRVLEVARGVLQEKPLNELEGIRGQVLIADIRTFFLKMNDSLCALIDLIENIKAIILGIPENADLLFVKNSEYLRLEGLDELLAEVIANKKAAAKAIKPIVIKIAASAEPTASAATATVAPKPKPPLKPKANNGAADADKENANAKRDIEKRNEKTKTPPPVEPLKVRLPIKAADAVKKIASLPGIKLVPGKGTHMKVMDKATGKQIAVLSRLKNGDVSDGVLVDVQNKLNAHLAARSAAE